MLQHSELVAFMPTTDAARAKRFYGDALGLTLVEDTPFAAVFDANGVKLRVTPVKSVIPADYTVLGWHVADLDGAVRQLGEAGVQMNRYPSVPQDELGVWTAPDGTRVAWFKDPDGNTLSLTSTVES